MVGWRLWGSSGVGDGRVGFGRGQGVRVGEVKGLRVGREGVVGSKG